MVKHYLRSFYWPVLMLLGVGTAMALYRESYNLNKDYEDQLDWLVFSMVKRGYRVEDLARVMYKCDMYSVEARSN